MKRCARFILTFLFLTGAIAACNGSSSSQSGSANGSAFIITTDFETGSFATMDISTRAAVGNVGSIGSDAFARAYNGLVYVVNRFGADNIQVLDPSSGYATRLQFSVGAGSNPQDIAFASGTKAYVSRYETAEIWIVNPQTGEQTGSIDLSTYADADGIPEMSAMYATGGKLYVALQKLDRNAMFAPAGGSEVIVIDMATDSVTGTIALPFQNPVGSFFELPNGKLGIACSGSFLALDGGIVSIGGSSATALISESDLGGDINSALMTSGTSGYVVISDFSFNTILKKFDTSSNTASTIIETQGFSLAGMATTGDELWISDRTSASPGVRIFDANTSAELTSEPVDTGLPPSMILFL